MFADTKVALARGGFGRGASGRVLAARRGRSRARRLVARWRRGGNRGIGGAARRVVFSEESRPGSSCLTSTTPHRRFDADGNEIVDGQVSGHLVSLRCGHRRSKRAPIRTTTAKTVQVRGEAVGEVIRMTDGPGDRVWVDARRHGIGLVGVGGDAALRRRERSIRSARTAKTGSRLRVQGVYNPACSESMTGKSDIHATAVAVEAKGYVHPDRFDIQMFFPGDSRRHRRVFHGDVLVYTGKGLVDAGNRGEARPRGYPLVEVEGGARYREHATALVKGADVRALPAATTWR